MRIEIPREVERFGPIKFHDVQKVWELDAGLKHTKNEPKEKERRVITRVAYESIQAVQEEMAIVVPIKDEKIKLLEGVLAGIPHHCQVIIVSNSKRTPVDRFKIEKDALEHIAKFMKKEIFIVHQKDPKLAEACKNAGYPHILDDNGLVRNGKAEGMILSTILAYLSGKKYIGFIDSDNYFPGAVYEYVQEYSAALYAAKSKYAMVRIAWHSKPKIVESNLFFAKRGRASEHTNKILNSLVSSYTGYGTEIIKTGNAGEHAMSLDLAMNIDYSSGYSIEPYHYINVLERFGGIVGSPQPEIMKQGVEFYQIESRNPHLHEVKGEEHVKSMSREAMESIYHSPICPDHLKEEIHQDLISRGLITEGEEVPNTLRYYPALTKVNMLKFKDTLKKTAYAEYLKADLKDYKYINGRNGLMREKVVTTDHLPEKHEKLEVK
ncbi:mannosyl-3-phosphoglycerate synthase [Roseivirga pacifica]|uniref:mannosyl-3-phosphoglycerate synthase n=1 Tax=Roseivirga pacifica TaxID=1267423 RepID=UPI00227CA37E|nr:mannosyl-3-phosphoglycerate synthase [Roseivirga pacifica]